MIEPFEGYYTKNCTNVKGEIVSPSVLMLNDIATTLNQQEERIKRIEESLRPKYICGICGGNHLPDAHAQED